MITHRQRKDLGFGEVCVAAHRGPEPHQQHTFGVNQKPEGFRWVCTCAPAPYSHTRKRPSGNKFFPTLHGAYIAWCLHVGINKHGKDKFATP